MLIKKINKEKEKYNATLSKDELEMCINSEELFTMEEIKNIQKRRLIKIVQTNNKYFCFDAILLIKFIFKKNNLIYKNPYTNISFTEHDINIILNVNVKKIKYFC